MWIVSSCSPLVRLLPWAALGLASCQQLDAEFCASHPQDVDCAGRFGLRTDAGMCTMHEQCSYPTPVCDKVRSMCVACTPAESGACGGATPVCGSDDACHGCAADAECASQTCLPDGACASPLDVLYAGPAGSELATCMPADRCSLGRAINLIDGTKSTIRLDPGQYDLLATLGLSHDLHLVGRGAVLDRNALGLGPVLDIPQGTKIALDYVTLQGGDGADGAGIRCVNAALVLREVVIQNNAGHGISSSGCSLAVSHVQIRNNTGVGAAVSLGDFALARSTVVANQGGGVIESFATYDIENNVIVKNGGPSGGFGGVQLSQVNTAPGHVFAFNTVAQNAAPFGITSGVVCSLINAPLALTSNIVVDNSGASQVEGANCNWTYSDIEPAPVAGTGNRSSDPLFVDSLHNNFHLQIASPVRDAADPTATLAVDIDGDARPQGTARDMGADEIK